MPISIKRRFKAGDKLVDKIPESINGIYEVTEAYRSYYGLNNLDYKDYYRLRTKSSLQSYSIQYVELCYRKATNTEILLYG